MGERENVNGCVRGCERMCEKGRESEDLRKKTCEKRYLREDIYVRGMVFEGLDVDRYVQSVRNNIQHIPSLH